MLSLPRRALTSAALLLLALAAPHHWPMSPGRSTVMAQSTSRETKSSRMAAGSISGRVTSGVDGVPGVVIELLSSRQRFTPQRKAVARTITDEDGRFRLLNVAAGRYYIRPLAPTFVVSQDNPRWAAKTIILDEGDTVEGMNFTITRGGVITGRVTDAEGRPVIGEMVRLDLFDERGQPQQPLNYLNYDYRFGTDDRGVYRIYGLPAGRYRVSVGSAKEDDDRMVMPGRRPYVRTFHPNTTKEAEAKLIELGAGGEATGVDIALGPLSEGFKASGRIVDGESGKPLPGIYFGYGNTDREQKYVTSYGFGDRSDQKGEFRLENLAPGNYAIFQMPNSDTEFYSDPVAFEIVDADVKGLEIKLRRGASLSGVAVIEGTSDRSVQDKLRRVQIYVNVERQGLQLPSQSLPKLAPDGSFHQIGLPPGKAFINIWPPNSDGLSMLRIERDGVEQSNGIEIAPGEQVTGLRLVFVYGTGVVRGRVLTRSGAMPEGMLFNVSVRRADTAETQRGFGSPGVEVDERGRFLIEGLASGEYELTLQAFPRGSLGSNAGPPSVHPPQPIVQRVVVTSGTQTEVTFTLSTGADESGG